MPSLGPRRLLAIGGLLGAILLLGYYNRKGERTWSASHGLSTDRGPAYVRLRPRDMPQTTYAKGVAGFSYFRNLYLRDGVWVAVTSQPNSMPEPGWIMCAEEQEGQNFKDAPAGPDRWMVVSPDSAEQLGMVAIRKNGQSMFYNDEKGKNIPSMLNHYYHFIGEAFMGGWLAIVAADPSVISRQELPSRMMFRTPSDDWRDRAGLTTWLQQTIMPTTEIEENTLWNDRRLSGNTFLFDNVVIIDRFSAHKFGRNTGRFNKMTGDLHYLSTPATWMKPLRDNLKQFLVHQGCHFERKTAGVPVVTYIDRQRTTRRLVDEDHQALLHEMHTLQEQGKIEFYDAVMEDVPRHEQFCLAVRTDVMLGVHGNGLSHQLWMKPGGTVIEIMDIGGFATDYFTPARLMTHDYYIIHNDTTFPKTKWVKEDGFGADISPGFHGPNIRVHGKFVAEIVSQIATERTLPAEDALL